MIKKDDDGPKKLAFTFWGLLLIAVMVVMFTLTMKVMDYNSNIKRCQEQSGYHGLEAKAHCRR